MDVKYLILNLSKNYDKIISRNEIRKYKELDWGDNGIGDRWVNGKFDYTVIRKKSYKTYSSEDICVDLEKIKNFQEITSGIGIIGILVHHINNKKKKNRNVKKSIKDIIRKKNCVVCGSFSDICIDHKNDYYDDPKVLCLDTQVIDDFQPLCNHCNLQKRQVCKVEKETKKIYSAKNIPQFREFRFDFPWEKTNAKSESYWYDPVEFVRKLILYNSYRNIFCQIKNHKFKE